MHREPITIKHFLIDTIIWITAGHDYDPTEVKNNTLLLLVFAGLKFSDFQKFTKLKPREKKFSRKLTTRNLIPCYIEDGRKQELLG